ncbi:MAG: HAD family hydrolase [Archangium sp.]|nr:HAD family hydrolase [Archangium sp.]
MPIRLVVTDMDNTLYSWIDYIVPAVESMVTAVQQSTGFTRLKVVQSLKAVYTKYESNEYPFALQESSLFTEFPDFGSFDKLVIEPARMAFAEARRKYLKPYKGVIETLTELKARRIPVVALTDAPKNPAEQRAKRMGFDQHLTAIYTMPGFTFPKAPDGEALVAPDILQKQEKGEYRALCPVIELPRDHEKPNPAGLKKILQTYGVSPAEVLVVGDSVKKDIAVARETGCLDCWAEYGTYISLEYRERLDIISSNAITRRHANSVFEAGQQQVVKPSRTLSNYAQVLELIDAAK